MDTQVKMIYNKKYYKIYKLFLSLIIKEFYDIGELIRKADRFLDLV